MTIKTGPILSWRSRRVRVSEWVHRWMSQQLRWTAWLLLEWPCGRTSCVKEHRWWGRVPHWRRDCCCHPCRTWRTQHQQPFLGPSQRSTCDVLKMINEYSILRVYKASFCYCLSCTSSIICFPLLVGSWSLCRVTAYYHVIFPSRWCPLPSWCPGGKCGNGCRCSSWWCVCRTR